MLTLEQVVFSLDPLSRREDFAFSQIYLALSHVKSLHAFTICLGIANVEGKKPRKGPGYMKTDSRKHEPRASGAVLWMAECKESVYEWVHQCDELIS
jgi:hypothetical protein